MNLSRALVAKGAMVFAGCALAASFVIENDRAPATQRAEPAARGKAAAAPAPRTQVPRNAPEAAADLDVSGLYRASPAELESNPFSPPKPPPPRPSPPRRQVVEAPPKPTAPPLPFRLLGQMIDDGTATLFLTQGSQSYSVKAGDTINDQYRLEAVTESQATFMYLPLQERQVLVIGSPN
jgi:hypothetical protein